MRTVLALLAAAQLLGACGDDDLLVEAPAAPTRAPAPDPPAHNARGLILAVSGEGATIRHEAVEDLGWLPGARAFEARDAQQASLLRAGQTVAFTFVVEGDRNRLTSVLPMDGSTVAE